MNLYSEFAIEWAESDYSEVTQKCWCAYTSHPERKINEVFGCPPFVSSSTEINGRQQAGGGWQGQLTDLWKFAG